MSRSRLSKPAAPNAWVSRCSRSRKSFRAFIRYYSGMNDRTTPGEESRHRLDKWLWHCGFTRRQLGHAAITGGKVHLNAERVKPAHRSKDCDRLSLSLDGIVGEFEYWVCRDARPAGGAILLSGNTESATTRVQLREQQRLAQISRPRPDARPDKRDRRRSCVCSATRLEPIPILGQGVRIVQSQLLASPAEHRPRGVVPDGGREAGGGQFLRLRLGSQAPRHLAQARVCPQMSTCPASNRTRSAGARWSRARRGRVRARSESASRRVHRRRRRWTRSPRPFGRAGQNEIGDEIARTMRAPFPALRWCRGA